MKLEVFQSDQGDCLLLTSADRKRVLVDGGMAGSYSEHVAPALGKLAANGERIEVVYVSHIDDDHIGGILRMLDDLAAWVVFDHHHQRGDDDFTMPDVPRPPKPGRIWHNAFRDTIAANAGKIAELLAACATILSGAESPELHRLAAADHNLAQGVSSALRVSRRIGLNQLNIPLNPEFNGKLMHLADQAPPKPLRVGSMRLRILGPRAEDLGRLRKTWNQWLRDNHRAVKQLRADAKSFPSGLGAAEIDAVLGPMLGQAAAFGDREGLTPPNLASLMFLVEEGRQSILLTGDGFGADVTKGLKAHRKLDAEGRAHFDILKVPHHGAIANIDSDFCTAITADHYVFCGNGSHDNPELETIETIAGCRLRRKVGGVGESKPFTFWFNSSETASARHGDHMAQVARLVKAIGRKSKGRVRHRFLKQHSFTVA